MCSQCLSRTGPAPAHGACTLPAHTAQSLGCSTGKRPRPPLGCMHFPGLSRSGSGTRVVPRGGLHFVQSVGPVFCALLRSEQLSDEVFGKRGCCDLSPPPFLPLSFLGVQPVYLLRRMLTVQNPKKSWLAMKPACSLVDDASLGPRLLPSGSGCPRLPVFSGGWASPQPASSRQSFVL